MQIIETLVFEQHTGMFEKLSLHLPLTLLDGFQVPIYRLGIDDDLAIFIYRLNPEQRVSKDLLVSLLPFLRSVILISDRENFEAENFPKIIIENLNRLENNASIVVALKAEKDLLQSTSDHIRESGLSLGGKCHMIFCDLEDKDSAMKVWKTAWGDLLKTLS